MYILLVAPALQAQEARPESLAHWAYKENLRPVAAAKYVDFTAPPALFDKARPDLLDLRLRDASDQEVPYALRIRRDESRVAERQAQEFNHTRLADQSDEVSLDLGKQEITTNEMVISTLGANFRRNVRIEGSDRRDGDWRVLVEGKNILRFEAANQTLSSNRISYPQSRFRYLRVRVEPDRGLKNDMPTITSVAVFETVREIGEDRTDPATLNPRQAVPTSGGPGSAWDIDLGGAAVPCSKLAFVVDDADFVRDFTVQILPEDPAAAGKNYRSYNKGYYEKGEPIGSYQAYERYSAVIASGQWRRRAGEVPKALEITFPETQVHRLRLFVTDNRNPPLNIRSCVFSAAARQVIFEAGDRKGPFTLYFGNGTARDPNYDFGRNLPATVTPKPERTELEGETQANPSYHPEPPPWTERWPWLIYVVLGSASAVLIGILGLLAKEVIRRHDSQEVANAPAA
jgi:hypothetical protein